jgi:hypothetical protein
MARNFPATRRARESKIAKTALAVFVAFFGGLSA